MCIFSVVLSGPGRPNCLSCRSIRSVEKETREHRDSFATRDAHLDRFLSDPDLEEPWFKSIFRSIREPSIRQSFRLSS